MDQSLNLGELLRGMWARKGTMLVVFVLVAGAVAFLVQTAMPTYSPEMRVIVEADDNPYTRFDEVRQPSELTDQEILSQVQVLLSHDLAARIASDLNLAQYPEFDSLLDGVSLKKQILIRLGLATDPAKLTVEQRVVDAYFERLNVYQIHTSRVIAVEFTSSDPKLAADIANKIGEIYVLATREMSFDLAQEAMQWLSVEIVRLRQKVVESEAAVEEYRAAQGLFGNDTETFNSQELSGINGQIILAAAARSEAQARAQAIRAQLQRTGVVDSSTDVLNSVVIQRLREQQVELQRQVADLSTTYLSSHPRMTSLNAEIDNLARQIRTEALKIVEALEEEARVQGSREASLRASLAELKSRETVNNQDEITLRALEREATANRDLLQTFLNRYSEASARQDILALPPAARIISRAQVLGEPTFPKKGPLLMLGLAGAAALAVLLAFAAEVLFPTPVEAAVPRLAAPAMAAAPELRVEPRAAAAPPDTPQTVPELEETDEPLPQLGPVLHEFPTIRAGGTDLFDVASESVRDPMSGFSVAIRRLSQKIRDERDASGTKRFVWTSGDAAADKLVIVANLARSFALGGTKTILVDADFQSRALAQAFKVPPGPGLVDLVAGTASFADVIVKDPLSGAHVLRLGDMDNGAADVLASQRVSYILDALDHAYELVLINSGPLRRDDDCVVARWVPYGVIVAQSSRDSELAGAQVQRALMHAGVGKIVTVRVQNSGAFDRLLAKYRRAA